MKFSVLCSCSSLDRYSILICYLIRKVIVLELEPRYLVERLLYRGEVTDHRTRQNNQLYFPQVWLKIIGRRGFSYFLSKLFNSLPCDLKSLKEAAVKVKV
ncbi:hypothetical protein J6590_090785 [Homalodisca vitripennis]|nr:hypothetical protein J6590_090785 [Homalodisca vitripennis]